MGYERLQRIAFWVFLTLVISSLAAYYIWGDELDLDIVREYLRGFGIWAPVIFIVVYILGTIFIPVTPFMALAGILFGFKYGLIYTGLASLLSSIVVFAIARKLGRDRVDDFLEKKRLNLLVKYNEKLKIHGVKSMIVLRMTPVMPFNVLNLLMGISKIRTRDYIIGTVLGLIPSNIITVYFGDIIARFF